MKRNLLVSLGLALMTLTLTTSEAFAGLSFRKIVHAVTGAGSYRQHYSPFMSQIVKGAYLFNRTGESGTWELTTNQREALDYRYSTGPRTMLRDAYDDYDYVTSSVFANRPLRPVYIYTVDDYPRQFWVMTLDGTNLFEVTVPAGPPNGIIVLLPVTEGNEYLCNYTSGGGNKPLVVPGTATVRSQITGQQFAAECKIEIAGATKWQDPEVYRTEPIFRIYHPHSGDGR